jgi:hypothetical protein
VRRVSITVNGAEHALDLDPRELIVTGPLGLVHFY